jgi:hypothetical protein
LGNPITHDIFARKNSSRWDPLERGKSLFVSAIRSSPGPLFRLSFIEIYDSSGVALRISAFGRILAQAARPVSELPRIIGNDGKWVIPERQLKH